jgi:hypothetical protein
MHGGPYEAHDLMMPSAHKSRVIVNVQAIIRAGHQHCQFDTLANWRSEREVIVGRLMGRLEEMRAVWEAGESVVAKQA